MENARITANRFAYLDFIPEVEYYIHDNVALGFGFNYGIKLYEQFKEVGDIWSSPFVETISSTDFGIAGKLKVNYNDFFTFVRYNIGLKDIATLTYTDMNGQEIENVRHFNRNIQIGIGYTFSLKSI